jgi:hypothetical protein
MWTTRSVFATREPRRPILLVFDVYGSVIVVGIACLIAGVTAVILATETARHTSSDLIHLHIFDLAAALFALVAFGFRLRATMRRLLKAAQQSA